MSDRHSSSEESIWTPVSDDELWAGPAVIPPALADPSPPLLNTHEMDWESFERLVLVMARTLDNAYDVRRYGRLGQKQHGLDVVAFFAEQPASVYQAKRWHTFGAAELEAAVNSYSGGERPFEAERIVIAVASEVRDARTIDRLAKLRAEHSDTAIELWDRQAISDRLRVHPRIVETFFGPATAAAFCSSYPSPTPMAGVSIAADAILRGPVAHLGLADELHEGANAIEARPREAAAILARVASRLEASGFVPHASQVRDLQAKALHAAGERLQEARVRLDLGWTHLDAGDTFWAELQVRELAEWSGAPPEAVRQANALAAAIGMRRDAATTLHDLAAAVDELHESDPHITDAALVLAEEAVAARRPDLVADRARLFADLAARLPQSAQGGLIAARIRMCMADSTGGWDELASTARETYPPVVAALVLARSARHLALVPQALPSIARWRDAIAAACVEGLNDDAADWLYALRDVRVQHELIDGDLNDLHRHAQALRAAGSGMVIPERHRARERALAYLRDEKWPDALEALRRYLWRSTIGADWSGELGAHQLLGDLFVRTGRVERGISHYVTAGEHKKLIALGNSLPDAALRLPIALLTARPWERTAAFSFAAASGDLIVDTDAKDWCSAAFRVISQPQPASMFAPNPWLAAFKGFGQLALVSTEDQARQFLEFGAEWIPRSPNTYRHTDEDQIHALIGIARAHRALRGEAIDELLRALVADQQMAVAVLRHGQHLLRADPVRTSAVVGEAAAEGNLHAAIALVVAEDDMAGALQTARDRVEAALAPREHEAGVHKFGTILIETAALTRALPEEDRVRFAHGMIEFGRDVRETKVNREEALAALRTVAGWLPDRDRDELFEFALPFAEGRHESDAVPLLQGGDDPLGRFRFSFGETALWPSGLMAAAALARSSPHYVSVKRVAIAQLRNATERETHSIMVALGSIPPDDVQLPMDLFAGHPSPWVRSLAAQVWASADGADDGIGTALAHDPSPHVRGSLARNLTDAASPGVRAILASDPRRSIRWLIRDQSVS